MQYTSHVQWRQMVTSKYHCSNKYGQCSQLSKNPGMHDDLGRRHQIHIHLNLSTLIYKFNSKPVKMTSADFLPAYRVYNPQKVETFPLPSDTVSE